MLADAPAARFKGRDHLVAATTAAKVYCRLVLLRNVKNAALKGGGNKVAELSFNRLNSAHGDLRLVAYFH